MNSALRLFRRGNKPVLRESAVLFVDVLGISQASTGNARATLLVDLDRSLREARHDALAVTNDMTQALTWFTDNVFMAFPIQGGFDHEDAIASALRAAAYIQVTLARDGFLCRGGITVGEVHMSRHFAFGPALIDAAELEKAAVVPQVLVSDSAAAVMRDIAVHTHADPRRAFDEEVVRDLDGRVFVDYLTYCASDDYQLFMSKRTVERHRSAIANALASKLPPRAYKKWEWAAQYHNYFCSGASATFSSHVLPGSALQTAPFL